MDPLTTGIAISIQTITLAVNAGKKFKQENTLERFLFGANGDFSGSEFRATSMPVRVFLKDPTITKVELDQAIKNWEHHWLHYGGKKKDKYYKNREAHINKIHQLMKAERPFALPTLEYSTIEEAKAKFGANKSENVLYAELNRERNRKTYQLRDRLKKWNTHRSNKPYHKVDFYPPVEPKPAAYTTLEEAKKVLGVKHYGDKYYLNKRHWTTALMLETERHKKDNAKYFAEKERFDKLVESENARLALYNEAKNQGATDKQAADYSNGKTNSQTTPGSGLNNPVTAMAGLSLPFIVIMVLLVLGFIYKNTLTK